MDRHPIQARIETSPDDEGLRSGVSPQAFREALSHWATTVSIVAVREGERVHATTVSSFTPVSADPPLVLVSLGGNAQVLPWMEPGVPFAVSLLADDQRRIATVFADSYPVGPSPFPAEGVPVVADAMATLVCTVQEVISTGTDAQLVLGRVESVTHEDGKRPLLYQRRDYRTLDPEG